MVAGSMAPDVPLSLPWPVGYGGTHSLVGLLTVDLAVRIVAAAAWLLLLREPLVDSAPAAGAPAAGCAGPLLAASVGADTAGGWSSAGRPTCCGTASPTRTRAVRHVDSPGDQHGLFRGQEWAQYVSGVTGLLVVLVTGGVAVGGAVACHPEGLLAMAYSGAVAGVVALGAGIIALAAAWHLRTLCVRETGVTVDTVCARRQDPSCLRVTRGVTCEPAPSVGVLVDDRDGAGSRHVNGLASTRELGFRLFAKERFPCPQQWPTSRRWGTTTNAVP